jgi:hypothetical protein
MVNPDKLSFGGEAYLYVETTACIIYLATDLNNY